MELCSLQCHLCIRTCLELGIETSLPCPTLQHTALSRPDSHMQADVEDAAAEEATEALHHSLSPAERSAIAESLPAESKAACIRCIDALGGPDCQASSSAPATLCACPMPACRRLSCLSLMTSIETVEWFDDKLH